MAQRPEIIILRDGKLNKDFFRGCALQNARAVLKRTAPTKPMKGRSVSDLITKLPDEGLEVEADDFRLAVWNLMEEGYEGNLHISLIALGPLVNANPKLRIEMANIEWTTLAKNVVIRTRQVLDSRLDREDAIRMLYIGQAEADVYDEKETYTTDVHGQEYLFKAYKVVDVPVFSRVDVDANAPHITIVTRAVHQKVRPFTEVEGVREVLRNSLGVEVPPLSGIGPGIRALWGRNITPRKYEVHEPDGSRVNFSCAPGPKNLSSEQIETALLTWEFKNGALIFDDGTVKAPFLVDAGRASFSFGATVTMESAQHVISEILAAAT